MAKNIQIRDMRNGEWHWVYNSVVSDIHLTPAEKITYSALATFGGCEEIHPNKETVAIRAGLGVRAIQNAANKLSELGYLEIKRGGGRGISNIYTLLKMPKGCKLCIVSKGSKVIQKREQSNTEKGAYFAPQLYNELNKELNKGKEEEKRAISDEIAWDRIKSLIELFKPINPTYETFFKNKTQQAALKRLVKKFGEEKVAGAVKALPRIIIKPYAPKITTPLELERDLGKLVAFVNQEKGRQDNKKLTLIQ